MLFRSSKFYLAKVFFFYLQVAENNIENNCQQQGRNNQF